jgi:hypothetical protein
MSTSEKSLSSKSTTQQTGHYYTTGFSDGFLLQNKNIIHNSSWLGENVIIRESTGKRSRKGDDIIEDLGDVDFLCRTICEVHVKQLFPASARCDTDTISTIPADCDLYIEVTSMSGELANCEILNKPSKVATKLSFYETIFDSHDNKRFSDQFPEGVHINSVNKIVIFVYNGADFVDLKNNFKSDKFTAIVVHLPMTFCISWEKDVLLQAKDKEVQEKDHELQEKDHELQEKESALQEKESALQEKESALQSALQEAINLRAQLSSLTKIQPEI